MKTLFTILLAVIFGQIVSAGTVSGVVLYQGDSTRPINSVTVALKGIDNSTIATYLTGPDGVYVFNDVPAGSYTLRGVKTLPGGGVTMLDATLVFLHILGFYPFDAIQSLAADVNGSGTITLTDYSMIMYHVLRHSPFPVGEWVFLTETFTVTDLKDSHPGGLTGSSAGDVGGVFVPGTRNLPAYPMTNAGTIKVSSEEPFNVSIKATQPMSISGTGLIINYPSDIVTIQSVEFPMSNFEYVIDGDQIRLIWNDPEGSNLNLKPGSELITIHCTANGNFTEGMKASFTLDGNTSIVSNTYTEITDAGLQAPTIEYTKPSLRLSNYPNPFGASTTLAYYLPRNGSVTLTLYDQSGQVVREYNQGEQTEGYHSMLVEGSGLTPGSYFCKISLSGSETQTIRLLKSL
ncbi:MAG: T9SS type A sorting domain-containing protein [Bacteroidetes bacterium]|nr:T9SS type A sorting domain-containing protein [Bacteroidota bacterium]